MPSLLQCIQCLADEAAPVLVAEIAKAPHADDALVLVLRPREVLDPLDVGLHRFVNVGCHFSRLLQHLDLAEELLQHPIVPALAGHDLQHLALFSSVMILPVGQNRDQPVLHLLVDHFVANDDLVDLPVLLSFEVLVVVAALYIVRSEVFEPSGRPCLDLRGLRRGLRRRVWCQEGGRRAPVLRLLLDLRSLSHDLPLDLGAEGELPHHSVHLGSQVHHFIIAVLLDRLRHLGEVRLVNPEVLVFPARGGQLELRLLDLLPRLLDLLAVSFLHLVQDGLELPDPIVLGLQLVLEILLLVEDLLNLLLWLLAQLQLADMVPRLRHLWYHPDLAMAALVVVVLQDPDQDLVVELEVRRTLRLQDELAPNFGLLLLK